MNKKNIKKKATGLEIAIIGMSGRFPGSLNIHEFWQNLKNGIESISFLGDEELKEVGVSSQLINNRHYVNTSGGELENKEFFDASFFDYTPSDAEIMNPQTRIFHECVWEALEDAGYNPYSYKGLIGLYAGTSSDWWWQVMTELSGKKNEMGNFAVSLLENSNFLCTQIAYKLNLKGPAVVVESACSTSLVAIHIACRALLTGECHIALAGGVSIAFGENKGYLYQEGMIHSPDGHCRAFDARAAGTIGGEGAGIVVLKRLNAAIADGDNINAVILGSAINNDGNRKVGYSAPSIKGQADVIKTVLNIAQVKPESITYIETHGTGTTLGDPIEVEALTQMFGTNKKGGCAIGSVKTNVGHLGAAAAVTGVIKTILALKYKQIPPTLNFDSPNPKIDFINSPFYVNTKLTRWTSSQFPLRAGISSMGIGGTNAHIILEEAPRHSHEEDTNSSEEKNLILLSAKTEPALHQAAKNLAEFLRKNKNINLADAAYTLQPGRSTFKYRSMLVCPDVAAAIDQLSFPDSKNFPTYYVNEEERPIVLIFPGVETFYGNMGLGLYQRLPLFRQETERCFQVLNTMVDYHIKEILYPSVTSNKSNSSYMSNINQTQVARLAIFIFQYALAKLLMKWGITPSTMIGDGSGEYVVACLSGVFSLEQTLELIISRGNLNMASLPGVNFSEAVLKEPNTLLLKIGPGREKGGEISSLVSPGRQIDNKPGHQVINLVRPRDKKIPDVDYLLEKIGQLWLYGVNINWHEFYSGKKRHRISLPTYPFQRQRFWRLMDDYQAGRFSIPAGGKQNPEKSQELSNWFYVPSWKRQEIYNNTGKGVKRPNEVVTSGKITCLLFNDNNGLGEGLIHRLKKDLQVITVETGSGYAKKNDLQYTLKPAHYDDYRKLMEDLSSLGKKPARIIHLWGVTGSDREVSGGRSIEELLNSGFYSLLYLARALGKTDYTGKIEITVITNNMLEVTGNESLYPGKAAALGPSYVIPQEYPFITCRNVDVTLPKTKNWQYRALIDRLIKEVTSRPADKIIAYRSKHRWVQTFDPICLQGSAKSPLLREEGVYMVIGGLGEIGYTLAEYLIKSVGAKLILTGRSPLPAKEMWPQVLIESDEKDIDCRNILKLQRLETLGGNLVYYRADVSDRSRMKEVIKQAEKRFGPINGVIHSAGITRGKTFNNIDDISVEECQLQFQAKLGGLLVLEELLRDKNCDFCLVISSTSSVLGGLGFTAYSAANNFMDAFSIKTNQENREPWIIVNWDGTNKEDTQQAFHRILCVDSPGQVIFSAGGDLEGRISRWVELADIRKVNETKKPRAASLHPRPELSTPYIAPSSQLEQELAVIWQNFFGIEEIGVTDDFFELGGDSLKCINIISKMQKELNVNISLRMFFNNSTIENIAKFIKGAEKEDFISIEPVEEKEYYSLSSAQKRLYILQQMDKDNENISHNMTQVVSLKGDLDRERLRQSLCRMIQRHESLRTFIVMLEEELVQRIHKKVEFEIEYYDLYRTQVTAQYPNPKSQELRAKSYIHSFIRPFNLEQAPFIRAILLKIKAQQYILGIDMHHLVSDGISLGLFVKELMALYQEEELPGLRVQYKDYAGWQNSKPHRSNLVKQEKYWLERFPIGRDIPLLNLPTDYPQPPVLSVAGDIITLQIDKEKTTAIKTLVLEENVTLFIMLLTIYYIWLFKTTGQEDIIIGTPTAGRRHADLHHIIGIFINTLTLRDYPNNEKTFRSFLQEVKKHTLEAFENQDYQFQDLVDRISVKRDGSRNPLFDVMFALENFAVSYVEVPGLKLEPYHYKRNFSPMTLSLIAVEIEGKLRFTFEYCTKLFKEETIKKFSQRFEEIVKQVLENHNIRLNDFVISHHLQPAAPGIAREDNFNFEFS